VRLLAELKADGIGREEFERLLRHRHCLQCRPGCDGDPRPFKELEAEFLAEDAGSSRDESRRRAWTNAVVRDSIGGRLTSIQSLNRIAALRWSSKAAIPAEWAKVLDLGQVAITAATKMKSEAARAAARVAMWRKAPEIARATRAYLRELRIAQNRKSRDVKKWLGEGLDVLDSLIDGLNGLERMVKELERETSDTWTSYSDVTSGGDPPVPRSLPTILVGSRKSGRRELPELLTDAVELLEVANRSLVAHELRLMVKEAIGRVSRERRLPESEQRNYIRRLAKVWKILTGKPMTYSGSSENKLKNRRKAPTPRRNDDDDEHRGTPSMRFLRACFGLLPEKALWPGPTAMRAHGAEIPVLTVRRNPRE